MTVTPPHASPDPHSRSNTSWLGYGYSTQIQEQLRALLSTKSWRYSDTMVRALHCVSQQLGLEDMSADQRANTAVIIGSSRGPATQLEATIAQFYDPSQNHRLPARTSPSTTVSAGSAALAQTYQLSGPQFTLSSACTSSLQSMGVAFKLMASGCHSLSLVGGAEDPLTPYIYTILAQAKVLGQTSPSLAIPLQAFGRHRTGMIPGQGAGLAILSTKPDTDPLTQILGYGSTTEHAGAVGLTTHAQGLQTAIRLALADAQLTPHDIHIIATHGSGTKQGDQAELKALTAIFGGCSPAPGLLITSWATGHTLGAAGIQKVGLASIALRTGECPLPSYPLTHLASSWLPNPPSQRHHGGTALVVGMGFGGSATALILRGL